MRIISRRVAPSVAILVTVLSLMAPAGALIDIEPPVELPPHDPVLIAAAGDRIEGWANAVLWVHTIAWNEEIARQEAEAAAVQEAEAAVTRSAPRAARPATTGTGACGGDLPDCSIVQCESGFDITAENGRSSAAGKYQFIQSTANNLARAMGRPDLVGVPASRWTEEEQDAAARILWRGGAGASNWEQCL